MKGLQQLMNIEEDFIEDDEIIKANSQFDLDFDDDGVLELEEEEEEEDYEQGETMKTSKRKGHKQGGAEILGNLLVFGSLYELTYMSICGKSPSMITYQLVIAVLRRALGNKAHGKAFDFFIRVSSLYPMFWESCWKMTESVYCAFTNERPSTAYEHNAHFTYHKNRNYFYGQVPNTMRQKIATRILFSLVVLFVMYVCYRVYKVKKLQKESLANKAPIKRFTYSKKQGRKKNKYSPYPDDNIFVDEDKLNKWINSRKKNMKGRMRYDYQTGQFIPWEDFIRSKGVEKRNDALEARARENLELGMTPIADIFQAPDLDWADEEEQVEKLIKAEKSRLQKLEAKLRSIRNATKGGVKRKRSYANRRLDEQDRVDYASGRFTKQGAIDRNNYYVINSRNKPLSQVRGSCVATNGKLYIIKKNSPKSLCTKTVENFKNVRCSCGEKQVRSSPLTEKDVPAESIGTIQTDKGLSQISFIGNYAVAAEHTVGKAKEVTIIHYKNGKMRSSKSKRQKSVEMVDALGKKENLVFFSKPKGVKSMSPRAIPPGALCCVPYVKLDDKRKTNKPTFEFSNAKYDGKGYNCSTFKGSCNAPLLYKINNQISVGGIHNMTDNVKNYSLMFTNKFIGENFH
jgi:hypothetical protein